MRTAGPSRVLLLLSAIASAAVCVQAAVCTDADKRYIFTPCGKTGHKQSIEFFQAGCEPGMDATSVALRAPVTVSCIKDCGSGHWWDPKSPNSCSLCPTGSMSNSGGLEMNDFRAGLPSGSTSYCSPEPCQPWQAAPSGSYLWSGNQSAGGDRFNKWIETEVDGSVTSTLVMLIPVINDKYFGRIMFKYRTESEYHFDGLKVFVNGTLVKDENAADSWSPFLQSGWHSTWTKRTVELPLGLSEVRFVYRKDSNQESMYGKSVGADAAFLRDFVIEGLQWYASECTSCPAGKHASVAGSYHCKTCPNDHYSNAKVGLSVCTKCEAAFWAPPGSGECRKRLPCGSNDYVATYTSCDRVNHKRDLAFELVSSRCDKAAGPTPAPEKGLECGACMRAFHRDPVSWKCTACPIASFYDTKLQKCGGCPAGYVAIKEITFDGFEQFGPKIDPAFFKTECSGQCAGCTSDKENSGSCTVKGGGWTLSPAHTEAKAGGADHSMVVIRTDLDNGDEFNTSMTYEWTSLGAGSVRLEYHFMRMLSLGAVAGDSEGYAGEVVLDGVTESLDKNFVTVDHAGLFSRSVPKAGKHTLVIRFSQESSHTELDPIAFVLQTLRVVGDTRGSPPECTVCPKGFYCPEGFPDPMPCPAGTFNPFLGARDNTLNHVCKVCIGDMIAPKPGSTGCQQCDPGSVPDPTHTFCINSCKFTAKTHHTVNPLTPGLLKPFSWSSSTTGVVSNTYDFDLTRLKGHVFGPIYLDGTDTGGLDMTQADVQNLHRFFVSPCTMVNTAAASPVCRENEDTYSCQRVNVNQSYAAGDRAVYGYTHPNLHIAFTGGDVCSHGGMARSTNVTFMCDPEAPLPGVLSYKSESPHCNYNFVLKSPVGCPLCRETSYKKTSGECASNGYRKVVYTKRDPNNKCQGGWTPPKFADDTCDFCQLSYYQETWDDCHFGKQNRIMVLKQEHEMCVGDNKVKFGNTTRSCRTVDVRLGKNGFTLFMTILIPILLLLIFFAMCFYCKFSSMRQKYSRLQGAVGTEGEQGGEMSASDLPAAGAVGGDTFDTAAEEARREKKNAAAASKVYEVSPDTPPQSRNGNGQSANGDDDLERSNEPHMNDV